MKRLSFFILGIAIVFSACSDEAVYEGNKEMESGKWDNQNAATFEFDVTDTVNLHDFFIDVRNGEEYEFSNLNVFIEMEFPNGKLAVDTLECPMADQYGNWLGRGGLGDLYDNRIIYKAKKQFPIAGHYKVSIHQAMRVNPLVGIYDVGFRLAKSK
ncbi:MAG: gliding motility lipoprotein GldH [Bacteroidota bacterium]|jgi:gliding motility-associated lipoprotein GldH